MGGRERGAAIARRRALRVRRLIERPGRCPRFDAFQNRADLVFVLRNDAFQYAALRARAARDQNLLVDRGRSRNHVRLLLQSREQRLPIANTIALHPQQVDVRRRTQQAVLQVLAKPVVDGQRDDQRRDARRHSNNRDHGDDPDDGLPPFGPQIRATR